VSVRAAPPRAARGQRCPVDRARCPGVERLAREPGGVFAQLGESAVQILDARPWAGHGHPVLRAPRHPPSARVSHAVCATRHERAAGVLIRAPGAG
jgi:hypothetical protein